MSNWNEKNVSLLKSLWGTCTAREIAEKMGQGFTRNSIIGKSARLNLSAKIKTRSTFQRSKENSTFSDQVIQKRGRKRKFILNKEMLDQLGPAKLLTLEELTETTCKYMIHENQEKEGHPDIPGSFFCGRDTVEKFSYCIYHMGLVWQQKTTKEDIIEKEDEVPQFIEKKIKSA